MKIVTEYTESTEVRQEDKDPKSKDSGGKRKQGHINRESRKLTRTLLTQSVRNIANSSWYLRNS